MPYELNLIIVFLVLFGVIYAIVELDKWHRRQWRASTSTSGTSVVVVAGRYDDEGVYEMVRGIISDEPTTI